MKSDIKRKKLLYRSLHRGCKEIDFLLGEFAKKFIFNLSAKQLLDYEKILDEEDDILYSIFLNKEAIPAHLDRGLVVSIIDFNGQNRERR
jgi:antitoxin CptB